MNQIDRNAKENEQLLDCQLWGFEFKRIQSFQSGCSSTYGVLHLSLYNLMAVDDIAMKWLWNNAHKQMDLKYLHLEPLTPKFSFKFWIAHAGF